MGKLKATFSTGLSGDRIACVMGAISVAEYLLLQAPPEQTSFIRNYCQRGGGRAPVRGRGERRGGGVSAVGRWASTTTTRKHKV